MTAEIAVMNKMAIALAADSAITIKTVNVKSEERIKIYDTNKLFMLSKYHPVGIMVFNNAELMKVPWETIIKSYRKELKETGYDSLEEYAQQFIAFLNRSAYLFPESEQQEYLYGVLDKYLSLIKRAVDKEVEAVTQKKKSVTANQIKSIVSKIVNQYGDRLENLNSIASLPQDFDQQIWKKYNQIFTKAINDVLGTFPISAPSNKKLKRFCLNLLIKSYNEQSYSGIVIAGFGTRDTFPSLVSYNLEGVINDTLRYKPFRDQKVDHNMSAAIVPFAQDEMVHTFMQGADPEYLQVLKGYLTSLFKKYPEEIVKSLPKLTSKEKKLFIEKIKAVGDTLLQEFNTALTDYMQEANVDPIISTVAFLPASDLALMAETLVNLTSFKRRVTMVAETVGGPIDVAVISKGDGFVWMKRKHYFEAGTNQHFFANYFR